MAYAKRICNVGDGRDNTLHPIPSICNQWVLRK